MGIRTQATRLNFGERLKQAGRIEKNKIAHDAVNESYGYRLLDQLAKDLTYCLNGMIPSVKFPSTLFQTAP